tara:strand:+ start:107 stop:835 length:729 start_codon:yes stop_codon:yes gene_type:complete
MKEIIKKFPIIRNWVKKLNDNYVRTEWVKTKLKNLSANSKILDAGCGSQQYRKFCDHLNYKGQDFGKYTVDQKKIIGSKDDGLGANLDYDYGKLDYIGNVWNINEDDNFFDVILCTEVLEHITKPINTIKEFSRLLKPGGTLILTAPSNCLRHMDPYFFYTGFSDRWFEKILIENGFVIKEIQQIGDYYSWLSTEMARTILNHNFFTKLILFPAFLYFYYKKETKKSLDTLCSGYHVLAIKK